MQLGSGSVTNIRRGVGDQMAARLTLAVLSEPPGFLAEVSSSGKEGRPQVGPVCGPLQSRPVINQAFLPLLG